LPTIGNDKSLIPLAISGRIEFGTFRAIRSRFDIRGGKACFEHLIADSSPQGSYLYVVELFSLTCFSVAVLLLVGVAAYGMLGKASSAKARRDKREVVHGFRYVGMPTVVRAV
jgi:hypothetical protein